MAGDQGAGLIEPQAFDRLGRRELRARQEMPMEAARRHAGSLCQLLDFDRLVQVRHHPFHQRPEGVSRLQRQRRRVLRLAARPAHVDDEAPRDPERDRCAQVLLDQREGEVDARSDACGGPDVIVAHPDRIVEDPDVRVFGGKARAGPPMRNGLAVVQQARLRQQECAGAHRADPSRVSRQLADRSDL